MKQFRARRYVQITKLLILALTLSGLTSSASAKTFSLADVADEPSVVPEPECKPTPPPPTRVKQCLNACLGQFIDNLDRRCENDELIDLCFKRFEAGPLRDECLELADSALHECFDRVKADLEACRQGCKNLDPCLPALSPVAQD